MADQGSEGFFSPYLRRKRIEAASPWLQGMVFDFGCGSGALAAAIAPDRYVGFDQDVGSLEIARKSFGGHRFVSDIASFEEKFDTVVALAVIEHVADKVAFLKSLSDFLIPVSSSRIVLTTPHRHFRCVHDLGASIGLFSRHAAEEHEAFVDNHDIVRFASECDLRVEYYGRFLFGANQVFVLSPSL